MVRRPDGIRHSVNVQGRDALRNRSPLRSVRSANTIVRRAPRAGWEARTLGATYTVSMAKVPRARATKS